jgi:signal transduction histidine kinase
MTEQNFIIFIVDDMPANLGILDEFLSHHGFEVLIAQDGKSALAKVEKAQPHLILLDILMPELDGFETCRHLKANPATHEIPIIFMTALTDVVDKVRGFELGAVDYITKPFEQEEVLARIKTHLRINQLQQQLQAQNTQLQITNEQLDKLTYRLSQQTEELRLANTELARAARLKDEFLANMSHELRTPLNAILGMAEVLQEGIYGQLNVQQAKSVHTIEASGRHLLALINDILELAKIEAGKIKLDLIPVSANWVGESCLQLVKELANKKSVKIQAVFAPNPLTVQADERYLKQILLNLLGNAIKFTPTGGTVNLEIKGDAQRQVVNLSVSDTGIGISTENMRYLFKPFVQLDGGLNRQHEGTGLGLALVYRLVEMHGGSVSVTSNPGQGSCFTVSLPWQATSNSLPLLPDNDSVAQPPVPTEPVNSKVVILLADDNQIITETIADYLTAKGYQIILAINGIEAIEKARENHPDLILMDIQMPEMDGLEATRRIRADTELAEIPIIALTALARPNDRERCLEAGANDYLSKPISFKGLAATIKAWLA